MAQGTEWGKSNKKQNFNEEEEQAAAKDEPMGSVAGAVPRDAGSATRRGDAGSAPPHKGGHATLVSGPEAREAEKPGKQQTEKKR
ncbi:MAG TPA: hypothetical protein VL986_11435 [Terracidiphilus sp.]|nr:hypothetical protein [Terracidiphilus sp.]